MKRRLEMKIPREKGKSDATEWVVELLLLGVAVEVAGGVVKPLLPASPSSSGSTTFRLNDLVTLYPLETSSPQT